jgi:hypothetical protein
MFRHFHAVKAPHWCSFRVHELEKGLQGIHGKVYGSRREFFVPKKKQSVGFYLIFGNIERIAPIVTGEPVDDFHVVFNGPIGKAAGFESVDELLT